MTKSDNLHAEVETLLTELFPIARSITGAGTRKTLEILQRIIPLTVLDYPSGKKCYDWTIPPEWTIRSAWVKDSKGNTIIDLAKNNLHVVNYSIPVHKTVSLAELQKHLFFREDLPDAIPYRTSYYSEFWGFCTSYNDFKEYFKDDSYEVFIDSELKNGTLALGELCIEGHSKKEFLISTYICHPSLANDNLSGMVLTAFLAREIMKRKTRHGYRFIFVPETIGAIAYSVAHEQIMKKIAGALVITCVAGKGKYGVKETFLGNHTIDHAIGKTMKENKIDYHTYPFVPTGSDERQYSSPGFRIPTASICKDKYGEYREYHTSLDNLDFISTENLISTLGLYISVIEKLEGCTYYRSVNQYGEAQLGRRGLYPAIGGPNHFGKTGEPASPPANRGEQEIISWILFYGDGEKSFFDVSEALGIPLEIITAVASKLEKAGLIAILD